MNTLPVPARPPRFGGAFSREGPDRARHAVAAGPFRIEPVAVAVPRDAGDVEALVAWAAREGHALIPRGAATGMPGGNVGHGVAVDLVPGLATIDEPDIDAGTIRCGAGANVAAVARVAARAGLTLPALPSSAERCTVGGMIANNAAGARSFQHGSTRSWVRGLDVVWADGTRSHLDAERSAPWAAALAAELGERLGPDPLRRWPNVRKNSSGYALDHFLPAGDALQLMVGSEGTLGIVVGAALRLTAHPGARGVLLVALPTLDLLPEAAAAASSVRASACELFGRRLVELARAAGHPLPAARAAAEALVLIEVEGDGDGVAAGLAELRRWAGAAGLEVLEATDEDARARLWEVRHGASPLIARAAEDGLLSTQFIEDSVVPLATLPDYLRGLDEILRRAAMDAVVFGHAGDGNVHVNPLVDVRTPGWRGRVRTILEETVALVAALGGTLSGEHGDGRLRAPLLDRIWPGSVVEAFRAVKARLDPAGILNPGVILPLPGQDPLEGLWPESP